MRCGGNRLVSGEWEIYVGGFLHPQNLEAIQIKVAVRKIPVLQFIEFSP